MLKKMTSLLTVCLLTFMFLVNVPVVRASALVEKKEDHVFFIDQIVAKTKTLANDNDLYASVMLAQAILASNYGQSELSQPGINNIYAMKGRFGSYYVKWGDGHVDEQAVNYVEYRQYPSYADSLADYVNLLKNGTEADPAFYSGAWKSTTLNYKMATAFLTTRYAEDAQYAERLNAVIELYHLTDFDKETIKDDQLSEFGKVKLNKNLEAYNRRKHHKVGPNETLVEIAKQYQISIDYLIATNHLNHSHLILGQELVVD